MPLPLFKLGALLAKQISKPLSKLLKEKAKQNEWFKNYVVIPSANFYHSIDITLRMRVLGLGSPDKVPQLTEKAAIELGGDILAEFFVFGTAAGAILLEYIRQSSNKETKEKSFETKVLDLEKNQKDLIEKLDKTTQRITEINKYLVDQKTKLDDLNTKLSKLDPKKQTKTASQGAQTTQGRQVGKVMHPKNSPVSAAEDVTNSVIYQVAEKTADEIKLFINKKEKK